MLRDNSFLTSGGDQFSKRYVCFDIDKLCDILGIGSRYERFLIEGPKIEGGFSKALLITTRDGSEYIIVKIPYPNVGRAVYYQASEVAVLNFSEKKCPNMSPDTSPDASTLSTTGASLVRF